MNHLRQLIIIVLAMLFVMAGIFLHRAPAADGNTRPTLTSTKPRAGKVSFDLANTLNQEAIEPKGQWYNATVPATLDLAERAKLSVNALTGDVEPTQFYGVDQSFIFSSDPPHVEGSGVLYGVTLTPRNVRTLPMLRAMTGSDYKLDTGFNMMRTLMGQIARDGQMYYPLTAGPPAGGTAYPQRAAFMAFAMLNWYYRDRNPAWLDWIDLLDQGLRRDAIQVGDRAYYPLQSGIDAQGHWHDLVNGAKGLIPYHTPEEPTSEQQGTEGTAKSDQARPLSALVDDYKLTGNTQSLEIAEKVGREMLKPGLWLDTTAEGYPGNEHGMFSGHFHGNVHSLIALLDLAEAAHDERLMEIVREGYDQAVRNGVVRMGWFPSWIMPEKYNHPNSLHGVDETCGVSDVAVLATRLSEARIGDYWDDVDSIARNQLIAQQVSNLDLMRKASGGGHEHDALLKRFVGGFGAAGPTAYDLQGGRIYGCCTGNGAQGLYYVWYGITQFEQGVATVNLFLNRASKWMDIDSYLPYEGKVVLHNKEARTAMVRIPHWVNVSEVKSSLDGKAVHPALAGRYLIFDGLKPKDEIQLEFPVREETDRYTINGKVYTVTFRGSTVINITPRDPNPKDYPLYQRDYYRSSRAPMHNVRRFVADRLIPLGTY